MKWWEGEGGGGREGKEVAAVVRTLRTFLMLFVHLQLNRLHLESHARSIEYFIVLQNPYAVEREKSLVYNRAEFDSSRAYGLSIT